MISEFLDAEYENALLCDPGIGKLRFLTEWVFNLSPYDDELAEKWGWEILDTLEAVLSRSYSCGEYRIAVLNLLDMFGWIEWGTSIRTAFFAENPNARPILPLVPFSVENIKELVSWFRN